MYCPRCLQSTPAFSTRCPHCTSEHGILQLWFTNLLGLVFAVGFVFIVILLIFSL